MSVIVSNGIELPEVLNVTYFKSALENGLDLTNIIINKINITMGSKVGENYCSDIYRANVNYTCPQENEKNEISLIVKLMKDEEKLPLSSKELDMYLRIIPEMEKILSEQNITLAPKCFLTTTENISSFVFQDLSALGYEIGDRLVGLDEAESTILLKKIGKFHAASMKLRQQNPELLTVCNETAFDLPITETNMMKEICLENLPYIADIIEPWLGYESIAIKLRKLYYTFQERISKCINTKGIQVLNHADLWINNFMFKRNEQNQPVDVQFIDLQISFNGSPGCDINYFLNTSVQLDVLKSKRDDLVKVYYDSLSDCLQLMNYSPIPTLRDIEKEILDTEFYGFWAFEGAFPIISMNKESSKDSTLETFNNPEEIKIKRKVMFSSKRMIETMKYSLFRFDQLGIFD